MAEKRLLKELRLLTKTGPSNPQILELRPTDAEESIFNWVAVIKKESREESTYYYNGKWRLDIVASPQYPLKAPEIKFSAKTPINHPNVNFSSGEICLDILKDEAWSPAWNLEHLVGAILMLIDDPEPDLPLNVDLANLFRLDKLAFESVVQFTMWTHGTLVDGVADLTGMKVSETIDVESTDRSSDEEDEDEEEGEDVDGDNDEFDFGNGTTTDKSGEKNPPTYLSSQPKETSTPEAPNVSLSENRETQSSVVQDEDVSAPSSAEKPDTALSYNNAPQTESAQTAQDHVSAPAATPTQPSAKIASPLSSSPVIVNDNYYTLVQEVPREDGSTLVSSMTPPRSAPVSEQELQHHADIVQKVGQTVCGEFLQKAAEVEKSHLAHVSRNLSRTLLAVLNHHVTENVTKQVDEIIGKKPRKSQPRNRTPPIPERKEDRAALEQIKAQFLRNVDDQVSEIRRLHAEQQGHAQNTAAA